MCEKRPPWKWKGKSRIPSNKARVAPWEDIAGKPSFEPTVLTHVTRDMDIARDMEVFGPVFPIIGFDTVDEAITLANASKYGLQGAVMSADVSSAIDISSRLQCGAVILNGSSRYRSAEMSFGGYKKSGIGREGISHTLEEMSQVKTIILKHVFQ